MRRPHFAESGHSAALFDRDRFSVDAARTAILANFAHIEGELTDDASGGLAGNQLNLVPPDSGRLWVSYAFDDAALKGFERRRRAVRGFGDLRRLSQRLSHRRLRHVRRKGRLRGRPLPGRLPSRTWPARSTSCPSTTINVIRGAVH